MKKQLKGIAIVLFGLLLTTSSIPLSSLLPGDYGMLFCGGGILIGMLGLFVALSKGD